MTLEIHLPKKISTNEYYKLFHGSRTVIKKEYQEYVWAALVGKRKKITDYPINVTYDFYLTGRPLDWVNLSAMTKMIEDALVINGVLENDSPKYISQGMMIYNKSKRNYNYCIIELG
jgi:hypothetical protein